MLERHTSSSYTVVTPVEAVIIVITGTFNSRLLSAGHLGSQPILLGAVVSASDALRRNRVGSSRTTCEESDLDFIWDLGGGYGIS